MIHLHRIYYSANRLAGVLVGLLAARPLATLAQEEGGDIQQSMTITELLLCLMTGWAIFGLTYLHRPEYGAYVASGAVVIYFAAALQETIELARERFR